MKTTALNKVHRDLGAKMVEFAGYDMPIEYSGIQGEHMKVRESIGVFDVSHMGEIYVEGPKCLEFLQMMTSNDVSVLEHGQAQYCYFPNGKRGIVDDLIVYCMEKEKCYLLVVNASNIEKDYQWLVDHQIEGITLNNVSDEISQLAVQGPKALEVLQSLTEVTLKDIPFYQFVVGEMAGIKDVIISNTGYTGSGGFELYCANKDVEALWKAVFEAGEAEGIAPIGLAARDTLRMEKGYCLYGNDIDDATSPLEAGLGWTTKFVDNKPFIDRPFLEQQKADGVTKRLRGFILQERGIPRHGYEICTEAGETIGVVTSGTQSPILKQGIGLGYIDLNHCKFGNTVYIKIRKKLIPALIKKLPLI
ncbi:glycine cleavage system aminomethyltransferase GcvT [Halosquirtibacter xylanolyticus]|uniref:glycine cleavage system aminomethyltransferase GcvT n=1 Tax=Halosquirtibacter xylanolyticus TaxID=3374599 RepID=UPI003748A7DA|nr:glycine cleavage system aminomethyltransferase GcvT [Prolixibacteraceae bacterium]